MEEIHIWKVKTFIAGNYNSGEYTFYFSIKNDSSLQTMHDRLQKWKNSPERTCSRIDLLGIEYLGKTIGEDVE